MKPNELFEVFSELDEALIADTEPKHICSGEIQTQKTTKKIKTKRSFSYLKKFSIVAVAILLAVALLLPMVFYIQSNGDWNPRSSYAPHSTLSPNNGTNGTGAATGTVDLPNAVGTAASGDWGMLLPMLPEEGTVWDGPHSPVIGNGNSYTEITENGFIPTATKNDSYFSIDAGIASFPDIRATIERGRKPYRDAVRIEEMLNYFGYDYVKPNEDSLVSLNASLFPTPYNRETYLLTVGLATEEIEFTSVKNNLVFLIDISGSMYSDDKLPLVQRSFRLLAENLNPYDRVSIVTYAGADKVALEGAYGYESDKIIAVIEDLTASGSTAGAAGIQKAYELAERYFIDDGNNRVILMTDGDFNVGVSSTDALKDMISEKRQTGVYFSVYGFGSGNLRADLMETLALNGNGIHGYIDSLSEACRVLVENIGGSMVTVAKDVKSGLVFNSEYIDSYRLIGYENKQLSQEEFENSETDAGELGSGHTATVVYEIKLTEKALTDVIEGLAANAKLADLTLKYKTTEDMNREETLAITAEVYHETLTETDAFVASVVEFGLLLRDSEYKANASFEALAQRSTAYAWSREDRVGFFTVVEKYMALFIGA